MAKQDIRKISIGSGGHPDNMMHYQVGVEYNLAGTKYKLTDIHLDKELLQLGKVVYNLYLQEPDGAKVLWKQIIDVPIIVENNINFE